MTPFTTLQGKYSNTEHMRQAVELDTVVYNEQFQGILDNCLQWFAKNPEIVTYLLDEQQVIGYISVLPITERLRDALLADEIVDVDIKADDIFAYEDNERYILYFCSVAIHPDYQGTQAFSVLYDAFSASLEELAARGIFFTEVIAEAVTHKGLRLCASLGLPQVALTHDGYTLFRRVLEDGRFPALGRV
ncbi:MAG: hypothetical protein ABS948_15440 [Solibacillus sp.]